MIQPANTISPNKSDNVALTAHVKVLEKKLNYVTLKITNLPIASIYTCGACDSHGECLNFITNNSMKVEEMDVHQCVTPRF